MNFTLGCGEDIAENECPEESNETQSKIDFKLRSEDFCAEMSIDVGIFGDIICFADANFQKNRELFVIGQKAYFLITVNSDLNPRNNEGELDPNNYNEDDATIVFTSIDLVCVTIRMGEEIIRLWEDGKPCPEDLDTGITLEKQDLKSNQIAFSFTFTNILLTSLKPNGKLKVSVGAEVEVKYSDEGSNNSTRRMMLDSSSDRSTFSTEQGIDRDGDGKADSAATLFACFFILIAALLL